MKSCIFLFMLLIISFNLFAQEQDSAKSKTFIYVLKLTPAYYDNNNWKDKDKETIQVHFKRLQDMLAEGKLITAGRTDVENAKTFGIVVFEADSFEDAVNIANEDPAVKAGIMSVEVFPFHLALMRNN
ncbi:MAG TPA: YciI family protein [Ignavibacteriaceae bacterium]|nr:YciI family protein [Ignavibacteriaceae bacterium]